MLNCNFCEEAFTTHNDLKVHLMKHLRHSLLKELGFPKKPYLCIVAGCPRKKKGFRDSYDLVKHFGVVHKKMMDLIPVKEDKVEAVDPILKENEDEASKVVSLESVDQNEEAAKAGEMEKKFNRSGVGEETEESLCFWRLDWDEVEGTGFEDFCESGGWDFAARKDELLAECCSRDSGQDGKAGKMFEFPFLELADLEAWNQSFEF